MRYAQTPGASMRDTLPHACATPRQRLLCQLLRELYVAGVERERADETQRLTPAKFLQLRRRLTHSFSLDPDTDASDRQTVSRDYENASYGEGARPWSKINRGRGLVAPPAASGRRTSPLVRLPNASH